jgi:hypothetical protein
MSEPSLHPSEGDSGSSWQAEIAGLAFPVNVILAMVILTATLALASGSGSRTGGLGSGDTTGNPTADPVSILKISGVTSVEGAIDGTAVHVGATEGALIVSFAADPVWHPSSRDCLPDIVGAIDRQGTTWIGAQAGHIDRIAGDPWSNSAYVAGLGFYCEAGRFASTDGGFTWSSGSLPGGATITPEWLAFDPGRTGTLLAFYPGTIYESPNSGASWTARSSTVTPLAFDSTGVLIGWTPGRLLRSLDAGASWQETGPGPVDRPTAAGGDGTAVLAGTSTGLWSYPTSGTPTLLEAGSVFSISTLRNGAVVLGADAGGRPWLGAVTGTGPLLSLAALPPEVATLQITGGEVAANENGAAIAFSGPSSAIAVANFAP